MPDENWINDFVFTVDDFLTPEECSKYIRISEDLGYEEALVSSAEGQVLRKDVRNNQRVVFQDRKIASWLWERAREFVPQDCDGRASIGVNEMLRFYRYDPGQQFNWHQDFSFERDNGERSFWTFMIYLNDDFEGGQTSFEDSYSDESFEEFQVVPKQGTALFFVHATHHKGEPVTSGRKYVLRTDVMFAADDAEYDNAQYDAEDFGDDDFGEREFGKGGFGGEEFDGQELDEGELAEGELDEGEPGEDNDW